MTNEELIAKIKAEIEREAKSIDTATGDFAEGRRMELRNLLSFLSTLESEKPSEGLEEELDRFIASGKSVTVEDCGTYKVSYHDFKKVARHFAQWGAEHSGSSEIPKDLEEAARKYREGVPIDTIIYYCGADEDVYFANHIVDAFVAGAKWQKEQMMKEAVEGHIVSKNDGWNSIELPSTFFGEFLRNYNHGDKVRIIVIPNTDEK